ncbi:MULTISPECIES: ParH-like protein [unclassified Streptomyces]|uniref:ParH-like protein n=1 Tax=unclassified Streptomyces TaxID=2593676 RepID=UPI001106BDB0|nr:MULTISPECIES: ParH-like protein [unclassified Streptomyces]
MKQGSKFPKRLRIPEIPDPFDVHEMFQRISRQRGRPIHLLSRQLPPGSPCGLWISTGSADYMLYEQATSPAHQDHILLHELGHLLHDHGVGQPLSTDVARTLMPSLKPELVQRVLGRTRYSDTEENEAETFASVILTQVSLRSPEPQGIVPPEAADVIRRLENTLQSPNHRRAK